MIFILLALLTSRFRGRVVPTRLFPALPVPHPHWEIAPEATQQHIVDRYFGDSVPRGVTCEIFYVSTIPVAALCWSKTNAKGNPIVTSVHFNRGLLMLFDAGIEMRYTLWMRYPSISFSNRTALSDFYLI